MNKKICTKCKIEKEISCFRKRGKNGFHSHCVECEREANRLYHQNNKQKLNQRKRLYHQNNKQKISQRKKKYYAAIASSQCSSLQTKTCSKCKIEKNISYFGTDKYRKDGYLPQCKDCRNEYSKKYHTENKDSIHKRKKEYYQTEAGQEYLKEYSQKHYQEDKENILLRNKNWREKNKEYRKEYHKKYSSNNRDKINAYDRKRRKSSIKVRLDENFSKCIYKALKTINESKKDIGWEKVVGYTTTQLVEHLESNFKPEMNWENYGSYWHIDHITPKSWFKYSSYEDESFKKCWSLDNLQPLEAKENRKKGNRYAG